MNRYFLTTIAIAAITAMAFTACTKKSETQTQTQTHHADEHEGGPGGDYEALPPGFGYLYTAILDGDLSEFAGTWVDGFGTRSQLRADGVFTSGSMGDLKADGFSMYDYGAYYWNVRSADGYGGFGVMVYPPSVPINLFYMDEGIRKIAETIETDTTKVRIIAGQDGPSSSAEVYYREGEALAAAPSNPHLEILNGDLSAFAGTWVNGRGERKQLKVNGTFNAGETAYQFKIGNENDQHIAGTYYQWIVNMGGEAGGFEVWLYPAGAAVRNYIEDYGWDIVATHITIDRIFVESVGSSYDVYYREGELQPPSDDWVLGTWMFDSGRNVYFFGQAPLIDFRQDKIVNVYEQDEPYLRIARYGTWGYTPEGRLFVEHDWNTYFFLFNSDMETLTIIDSDGDRAFFGKVYG